MPKARNGVRAKGGSSYERIWAVVRRIPAGRVATYGQVARLAGLGGAARLVGYALHALPEAGNRVPWQRVINSQGRISQRGLGGPEQVQKRLLEREGVRFDGRERVDLARYGWSGKGTR
jgi:methylated-DNA-protein-cysteine methyltransferase related protein